MDLDEKYHDLKEVEKKNQENLKESSGDFKSTTSKIESNINNEFLSENKESIIIESQFNNNLSENLKNNQDLQISQDGTVKKLENIDIIDDITNRIGINCNNSILFVIIAIFFLADGAEMILISLIVNKLENIWKLSSFHKSLLGASVFTGFYAGALIGGKLSSNIGRKYSFILGAILVFIFGIISAFSMNIGFLAICRAILGLGVGISIPASSSLLAEITPLKYRSLVLSIISITFPIGEIMIIIIAKNIYLSHSENWWKILLFISPIPISLCLILSLFTFESPRYLLVKGRYTDLIEIFNKLLANSNKPILTKDEEDNIVAMSELKKFEDKLKHKELIDFNFDLNEAKEQEMESEILDENNENSNSNKCDPETNKVMDTIINNTNNTNNTKIKKEDKSIKEIDWEYELVKLKNKPHDLLIIKVKELNEKLDNDFDQNSGSKFKHNVGYSSLLTSKYFKLSFHCSVLFFVNSFVYYGLIYILPQSFNSHIIRNSNLIQNSTLNENNVSIILNNNSNFINNTYNGTLNGIIQSDDISNFNTTRNNTILNSSYYSDELFDNLLISCVSEIPASLLTVVVAELKFIGRKDALKYSFLIVGISSFIIVFYSNSIYAMSTSMKFFISISFSMNYIYVAEAFPTKLRAIALAFCNSFTRLAGVFSPLILQALFNHLYWLPYLAFFITSLWAALSSHQLPFETKGKKLEDF